MCDGLYWWFLLCYWLLADMLMPQSLIRRPLHPKQEEYVRTVSQSAESLLAIVNDVLDLSRVEAGKLALVMRTFTPAEVARNTVVERWLEREVVYQS